MEVKMRPIALEDIPGFDGGRVHDTWATEAVERFVKLGESAVELEVPEFDVSYQTVRNLLGQHGVRHGVKVRTVNAPEGRRTFLYRKEAR